MPMDDTQYEDIFLRDIQEALETMYKDVGPLDGQSNRCDRVLAMAESAVDDVFFRRNRWLDEAYSEMIRGLVRKWMRAWSGGYAWAMGWEVSEGWRLIVCANELDT